MWFSNVDFPIELVESASRGEVVIFVGAGASLDSPSDLPSFEALTDELSERLGTERDTENNESLDEYLGRLADAAHSVHNLVAERIGTPGSEPNRLHRAIARLAMACPPVRIVTTNYDLHIERALESRQYACEKYAGPAVPLGDDFEGVVHLHGALGQDPRRLVLTDTDFGRAYLRDAWAARFLERMFHQFTVLFVGYSHDDVVMKYLARAIGRGDQSRRYALTFDSSNRKWVALGITPVAYEADGRDHSALPRALERWSAYTEMGLLDHRSRIREFVTSEGGVPLIPEERTYLEGTLGDEARLQFFTEFAVGSDWLRWVSTRPEFERLVSLEHVAGRTAVRLAAWIAQQSMTPGRPGEFALQLLADKPWCGVLWDAVIGHIQHSEQAVDKATARWVLLALARAEAGSEFQIASLLAAKDWAGCPEVALMAFEWISRPALGKASSISLQPESVELSARFSPDHFHLQAAWKQAIRPLIPVCGTRILDLVARHLVTAAALQRSGRLSGYFDSFSFGRSAIEPHEQDSFAEQIDVLIDGGRETLEHLVDTAPATAGRHLVVFAESDCALLRRLAVHGWRRRTDVSGDDKVRWVLDQNLLYEWEPHHEVFQLLKDSVGQAAEATVNDLIARVLAGPPGEPPHDDGRRSWNYARYSLMEWLHKSDRSSSSIKAAFDGLQAEHPDFAPLANPDNHTWMEFGTVEDAPPFTVAELHHMVADDAAAALQRLDAYRSETSAWHGPTWAGALGALTNTVAEFPEDGLALAPLLNGDHQAMRPTVIDGWSKAEVPPDLVPQVLCVIEDWGPSVQDYAGKLLSAGGHDAAPTAWHEFPEARALAARLWPNEGTDARVSGGGLRMAAINSLAGDLAYFWIFAVQADWRQDEDGWNGLTDEHRRPLEQMVGDTTKNGLYARSVLLGLFHFLLAADEQWTKANLLPLASWEGNPNGAADAWESMLSGVRFDRRMLDLGLLDEMVATAEHSAELGDKATHSLAKILADITIQLPDLPDDWPHSLIRDSPPDFRVSWAEQVTYSLKRAGPDVASAQWEVWVRDYWTDRLASVPARLTPEEASAMVEWVLFMPKHLDEANELAFQVPLADARLGSIWLRLADADVSDNPSAWALFTQRLLYSTNDSMSAYRLRELVDRIRRAAPSVDVAPIVEGALRLGIADAATWIEGDSF